MDSGIGRPVRRKEDHRLLTGHGRYSDDLNLPGQAHAIVLRSPYAHARIRGIDISRAAAAPGVLCVLTGRDWLADGLGAASKQAMMPRFAPRPGERPANAVTHRLPAEPDEVRWVGDIVALAVAETREQAKDAAELIEVDYEPLPVAADAATALAPGAPKVWQEADGNLCISHVRGDRAATEAAFVRAAHVVAIDVHNNRVTGVPMEPRACVAEPLADGGLVFHAGGQGVRAHRDPIAEIFGLPEDKVRVLCHDVGGGFGTRNLMFPEFLLSVWAARRLGRPVKWLCERSEGYLSDPAARDVTSHAELALDSDGRFLAIRVTHLANFGTEALIFLPFCRSCDFVVGVYDFPAAWVEAQGVFSHTGPISVLRSAGRPEPMFMIERLIDTAAAELGFDPLALRRRNHIPADKIPYLSATDVLVDSGDFATGLDKAVALADWDGFAGRRAETERNGLRRGIGVANYIEWATGQPEEHGEIEVLPSGRVAFVVGTMASGQGHETAYAQIIADFLGVPFEAVDVLEGDSFRVMHGRGSHSSRSMRLAGTIMKTSADQIIDKGRRIAAQMLEAAEADIGFAAGVFTVTGTDRSIGLFDVARAAQDGAGLPPELQGRLTGELEIVEPLTTFPNGCHVCEVEVDVETGAVRIVRYSAVDDVGRVINPLLVDGQTHGGIVMGAGQALKEICLYDRDGQLLTGSFMDYGMPRADEFPFFTLGHHEVLAPNNPLGIKGAGEGGTAASPPAIVNAIVDALRPLGVRHIDMPATPENVWQAIRDARSCC